LQNSSWNFDGDFSTHADLCLLAFFFSIKLLFTSFGTLKSCVDFSFFVKKKVPGCLCQLSPYVEWGRTSKRFPFSILPIKVSTSWCIQFLLFC
jgi:hypothetical protein